MLRSTIASTTLAAPATTQARRSRRGRRRASGRRRGVVGGRRDRVGTVTILPRRASLRGTARRPGTTRPSRTSGFRYDALPHHEHRRRAPGTRRRRRCARTRAAPSGRIPPRTNCPMNRPNSIHASRTLMLRLASTAIANTDCAAVRNSSSRCSESSGSPVRCPAEIANTIGSEPTSSVHWFTFDDSSVPSPALVLSRHANSPATTSSGASDASGATHCTSRNVLDAGLLAEMHERLRERLRAQEDHAGRVREQHADDDAPLRRWAASPMSRAGPDEMGLLRRRRARGGTRTRRRSR